MMGYPPRWGGPKEESRDDQLRPGVDGSASIEEENYVSAHSMLPRSGLLEPGADLKRYTVTR